MRKSDFAITLTAMLQIAACGSNSGQPTATPTATDTATGVTSSEPSTAGAKAPDAKIPELGANEKVLAFQGYDGPKGTLGSLPAAAWTVAPVPSGDTCTFDSPTLSRQRIIATQAGLVVFSLESTPTCRFAVPPALVYPDDSTPPEKGAAVLVNRKGIPWYGRVVSVSGERVSVIYSSGTTEEMKFDPSALYKADVAREDVRVVKDGFGFGSRVLVPNGNGLMDGPVFAATDSAVFLAQPFNTKYARGDVTALHFSAPIPDGSKVFAKLANGGAIVKAKVNRTISSVLYEVQGSKGAPWAESYEDTGLAP